MDSSNAAADGTDGKPSECDSLENCDLMTDGEQDDAKIIGHNTDTEGETVGVWGETDSEEGYGLATPDDSKIDGDVDGGEEWRVTVENDEGDVGNVVQDDPNNSVDADSEAQTIAGGEDNQTDDSYATVGGGRNNESSGSRTTVAGGWDNVASESRATVAGGSFNEATGVESTIAGGNENKATATTATVGGGAHNEATGTGSTVPGGQDNEASGNASFAAGRFATASHNGAIVFGDSSTTEVESQNEDEARFQMEIVAEAGVDDQSARAAKTNVDPVDPHGVLDGVRSLDVSTWEYVDGDGGGDGRRHIGPMAEDFEDALGIGNGETINSIDRGGVAFAAIQRLAEKLEEKDIQVEDLEAENARLRDNLDGTRDRVEQLEETVESLTDELDVRNPDSDTDPEVPADD